MSSRWTESKLSDGSSLWKCTACGLLLGGEPMTRAPGRCAVCSARAGAIVAVLADPSRPATLSMMVLDRDFMELVATYRAARAEHEHDVDECARINELGNYDTDDDGGASADLEASSSHEQRSALALAEATSQRLRVSRPSIPGVRDSRHSQ